MIDNQLTFKQEDYLNAFNVIIIVFKVQEGDRRIQNQKEICGYRSQNNEI